MSDQSDRTGFVTELLALVVADALVGVDFSLDDWVTVLHAHNGGFSARRARIGETARPQLDRLALAVFNGWDDDNSESERALAQRIEALPTLQKIAILDVIDRYWALRKVANGGMRDALASLGVVFADTAHAKLRAAAAEASWRR